MTVNLVYFLAVLSNFKSESSIPSGTLNETTSIKGSRSKKKNLSQNDVPSFGVVLTKVLEEVSVTDMKSPKRLKKVKGGSQRWRINHWRLVGLQETLNKRVNTFDSRSKPTYTLHVVLMLMAISCKRESGWKRTSYDFLTINLTQIGKLSPLTD
ncbi:hypothetical protein Tco_0640417 [Tanacetum coccineum]